MIKFIKLILLCLIGQLLFLLALYYGVKPDCSNVDKGLSKPNWECPAKTINK